MANEIDFLNSFNNTVVAINSFTQAQYWLAGQANSLEISASALIKNKSGWVAKVSIIVAGSGAGMLYDASTVAGAVAGVRIASINNALGVQIINIPFTNGLIFIPGSGMIATIIYS